MGNKQSRHLQHSLHASGGGVALLIVGAILACAPLPGLRALAQPRDGADSQPSRLAAITIDYPQNGSIFPPEITPPTFIWHDAANDATHWRISIAFTDGSPEMHFQSAGERLAVGEIDPRCVSDTNELPMLTPELASAHSWIPEPAAWEAIKKHSVAGRATVTIRGFTARDDQHALSSGRTTLSTSIDPVGAPIFYRDVPLMPSETEKGIIKPLAPSALHLVQWRLRDIAKPESRIVLKEMPTCGNCHSFSLDGKTMGMDLDGPANNKGLYAIVPVQPQMTIRNQDVISWSSLRDDTVSTSRIGFMSQISPDGRYVLTNYRGQTKDLSTGYFTVNFKDYRFLQVFYPTRSIVAWYNRATGRKQPLPGADDPRYVQTNAVWSPDGKYVVFIRAEARDPYPPGNKMPQHANDPEEPQIQYDLYRVPFNDGRGGQAVPIAGASHNGMSNSFPKISPDGRWIVWVQCRNAELMRPDSQLYIVPAMGGVARRMRCNTSLMNSWHSFSPNGHWLVFSSKSRSPYTKLFLTHLDAQGNDSPAILIDNSTAANRAVNIPEFVNIPPDGLMAINTPAVDVYKEIDRVTALENQGQIDAAIAGWNGLLATNPDDARIHNNLGTALTRAGRPEEAIPEFEKALKLDPEFLKVYFNLGRALLVAGRSDGAILAFERGLQYDSESADLHYHLGLALASKNRIDEAQAEFSKSLQFDPKNANAHFALGVALASKGNGDAAITEFRESLRLNPQNELAHLNLGVALNGKDDFAGAIAEYREALRLEPGDATAHYNLGVSLGHTGDWDGEVAEEREALRLNPQIAEAHRDLGLGLARKGDIDASIEEYREALRLNPNDEVAHVNLGLALVNKGDWESAISEEREALRLDPNDGTAHVYLGALLEQKGDRNGAIAEYREALRLNSNNHLAHYDLGVALEKKGDLAGALQEYRAAYELNPQIPPYRKAYERLSQPGKQ
ncbi:MAG: tetratricopeptide repeat protein [Terriglobia bacterium]